MQQPLEKKALSISSRTTDGRFLFFTELDEPYDKEKKKWLKKFSKKHDLPLIVVESSTGHIHILSFNLFNNPVNVATLQMVFRFKFKSDYPDLMTTLFKFKHPYGNILRVGYKNGTRPTKLLDSFIFKTDKPASGLHLELYQQMLSEQITLKQPIKKPGISFYETDYTKYKVFK